MSATADLLSTEQAAAFARIALGNVVREYPAKQDHVLGGPDDVQGPRQLHPAFYGSFDWHSCVHMHWLLARVRRLFPFLPVVGAIEAIFDAHLTPANIAAECAYCARPLARGFERTYGWAWLLELAHELARATDESAARWQRTLRPLVEVIVAGYLEYLPRQRYAIRHGLHANSAFGLAFALDWARASGQRALANTCTDAAQRWFVDDCDVPVRWEPSGSDFLSPALMEADCMRRVLAPEVYDAWLAACLPALDGDGAVALLAPALVDERSDGQLVHLDGLNLARAWNLRGIVAALRPNDARVAPLSHLAALHLAAGLAGVASDDYGGAHWLATFATLALTAQADAAHASPVPGAP
ncbi:MAG: DUF2891 domain-containing protein [Burkholderiales bacterium]|nr:DUF2891 domain-containing protein [Burkholderiales bacterium]